MRSNRLRFGALVLIASALLAACGGSDDPSTTAAADAPSTSADSTDGGAGGAAEGATPPTFTAPLLGGGELTAASFAGTPTVLWFWAPWCTSCRAESDDVLAAAAAVDGRVEVIGVAGRGDVADMEDFVADTATETLPHAVDADGSIWSSFEVVAQPAFAFIAADGEVEVVVGAMGEQALTERMEALAAA